MKIKNVLITLASIGVLIYAGFLIKKSFYDQGYPTEKDEKEILLGYYVLSIGLPNTKNNRNKYNSMTLKQLKDALGINDVIVE
jgi:hypothetical protein